MKFKQCDLADCSRDYLEHLAAELELQAAAGKPINREFLDQVRAAIPTAPPYFVLHAY
jgi:hypothetical protein